MGQIFQLLFRNLAIVFLVGLTVEAENFEHTNWNMVETKHLLPPTLNRRDCALCDAAECGPNAIRCAYTPEGFRRCTCQDGYAGFKNNTFSDEICEKCECETLYPFKFIDPYKICKFEDSVKKCRCKENMIDVGGKCKSCNCGPNAISCDLDDRSNKQCYCKEGYAPLPRGFRDGDQSCKKCECGTYGVSCSFKELSQNCKCDYGGKQTQGSTKCKECDCGVNSMSCYFDQGVKRCSCVDGYEPYSENIWKDEYCASTAQPEPPVQEDVSFYKTGTYIMSALSAVIIIGLLIVIVNKQKSGVSSGLVAFHE